MDTIQQNLKTYPNLTVDGRTPCPFCDSVKAYQKIAMHWHASSTCNGPSADEYPTEVMNAIMMGPTYMEAPTDPNQSPRLEVETANQEAAEWINYILGIYASGDVRERDREKPIPFQDGDLNYGTTWGVRTIRLKEHTRYSDWFCDRKKKIPDSIELTPMVRNLLFAFRGSRSWSGGAGGDNRRLTLNLGWSKNSPEWWLEKLPRANWHIESYSHTKRLSIHKERDLWRVSNWFRKPPEWAEDRWIFEHNARKGVA